MIQMNYRYEIKYMIHDVDALALQKQLEAFLKTDQHSKDGSYLITSLYFDTLDSEAYYEKMDGVLYRSKYRIRYYDDNFDFIRLEKKMKHNNMTAKRQTRITKEIADLLIAGKTDEIQSNDSLLQEFISMIRIKHFIPSVVVKYHRVAFTYPISDVRITFDSLIHSGVYDTDLWNITNGGQGILDSHLQVLEVKYNEVLPTSIAGILSTVPLRREAVSKFARCAGRK